MKKTHLTDFLEYHALKTPGKLAVVFENNQLTWSELNKDVNTAAHALAKMLGKSDKQLVVGILLPNSLDYVITYLAILQAGHIAFPINPIYKALEINAITDRLNPELIISEPSFEATLSQLKPKSYSLEKLLRSKSTKKSRLKFLRNNAKTQIATLLFTSGTTGTPKITPYTHANYIWNIESSSKIWDWTSSDTILLSIALSHWYGIAMGINGALIHGNTMHIQRRFNAEATLKRLSKGDITIFTHVSTIFTALCRETKSPGYNLSNLRLCISGAAPLPPKIWKTFKRLYGIEIIEAYGTSETGRIASNTLSERQPGSPGPPLPGVAIKLSSNGELLVKSPGVFPGYYKNEQATREKRVDGGWWRTGDIAEIKEGRVHLKGRTVETINRWGYILYPRDIEWAVMQLSGVVDVYVLGLKTSKSDDDLIFFVVGDVSKKQIIDHCKANLPAPWRPSKIIQPTELPKSHNGKPELSKLRALVSV